MASLRQYNIVTLGNSGVGKSTFINSLSNLMTYETFNEAITANQPRIIIDTAFQLATQGKTMKINMRGLNPKDVEAGLQTTGSSATTKPAVYSFGCKGVEFNIIDVPGVGDTGGIQQDAVNRQAIIKEISRFPEIHGIIIMLKIDVTRVNSEFQYCINEILSCFHKNAQENLFFVLTYSGTTQFATGDLLFILQNFLKDLNQKRGTNISVNDRIFLVDNEPFRFLCGYNQSHDFRQIFGNQQNIDRLDNFWRQSRENVFKLLKKMYLISGHRTEESRIIAQANTAIQCCVSTLAEVMQCIAEAKTDTHRERSIRQLMGDGTFDKPDLEIGSKFPRLVCIDKECVQLDMKENKIKTVKFKQVCHENCRIDGVTVARCPEPLLIDCQMFDLEGICRICKHHVDKHMHLPFEVYEKYTKVQNNPQKLTKENAEKVFNEFIRKIEQEQTEMLRNMAPMLMYCQKNAIVAYNNSFKNKVEMEIQQKNMSGDMETVKELTLILKQHDEIINSYNAINNANSNVHIKDVVNALNRLFTLKIYGNTIRTFFDNQLPDVVSINFRDYIRLQVNYIPEEN